MINIYIPQGNNPEKEYIINLLFTEFLGLPISIKTHYSQNYLIKFDDAEIILEDHFWGNQSDEDYLKVINLPKQINILTNELTPNNDLPLIYGTPKFIVANNTIVCGLDLFASSFFMLSRWEEYVNLTRDIHNRFPGEESIAYKYNFIDRPIVNEYVEFLWDMLLYLGFQGPRKERKFRVISTVDVDQLYYFKDNLSAVLTLKYFIKHGLFIAAKEYLNEYYKYKKTNIDPADTYNKIMDISEKNDTSSYFFFLVGSNKKYDKFTPIKDKRFTRLIKQIENRGHFIGFHPGYDTYDNPVQWQKAKSELDELLRFESTFGRQHYLRLNVPQTFQIWEQNNMEWDSSMGYPDIPGFRCGTCYEFSVFDILKRKTLHLKEFPLLLMDVTLKNYLKLSPQEAIHQINLLIKNVAKYDGNFVFLWHNTSLNLLNWDNYKSVYDSIWE